MCDICKDTGWEIIYRDGKSYAKRCKCQELIEAEAMLKRSGISEEFQKKGFKNFDDRGMPLLKKAREIGIDYCKRFPEIQATRDNSVMFMGQVGSGKTHLSMAICNAIMDTYKTGVVYMPYREEITRIKQTVTDETNYNYAVNRFKIAPVLMVDDLLKGKVTEADVNVMFEIINYRYMKNLPMIVSTEKSIGELLDYDEGTMSRLIEMSQGHQLEIKGREYNYRLRETA